MVNIFSPKSWLEEWEAGVKIWRSVEKRKPQWLMGLSVICLFLSITALLFKTDCWAKLITLSSKNFLLNGGFEEPLSGPSSAWGTGSYEKKWEDENKSRPPAFWITLKPSADIKAMPDYSVHVQGDKSLKIINNHGQEDHVFGTISQKVNVLPNRKYLFSFAMKVAEDSKKSVLTISLYPDGWKERIQPIWRKTQDWFRVDKIVSSREFKDLDIRFISEDSGTVWIDDVQFKEIIFLLPYVRWGVPITFLLLAFLLYARSKKSNPNPTAGIPDVMPLYLSRLSKGTFSLGDVFNKSADDLLDLKMDLEYTDKIGKYQRRAARVINHFDDPLRAKPYDCRILKRGDSKYIVDFPRVEVKVSISGKFASTNKDFYQECQISAEGAVERK